MVFEGLTLCYQPHRHIVFQKDIFDSNIVYIANVRKLAFLVYDSILYGLSYVPMWFKAFLIIMCIIP